MSERLALALQKPTGKTNLGEETVALLRAGGLKFNLPSRVDDGPTNITGLDIWMMRNGDVTRAVAEGEAALGIVGLDKYYEYDWKPQPLILKALGYSGCTLKLGVRKEIPYEEPRDLTGFTIATSYPVGSRRFFEGFGVNVRIRKYEGGSETAVKRGLAEGCIEVCDTGYSMRVNGVRPVQDVLESQAVLIANTDLKLIPESEEAIRKALGIVMTGLWKTQYRMMKFNYPVDKEDAILVEVPARESPTVMPLQEEGLSAAETLVPLNQADELVEKLLLAGARDIFTTPIEKLYPNLDDPEVTRMMRLVYG